MKPRITSMIWNIRKQKTTYQNNNKKRESRKKKIPEDNISSLWDNFKRSNIRIIAEPKEMRKRRNWKSV